jgi:hypothetical protein
VEPVGDGRFSVDVGLLAHTLIVRGWTFPDDAAVRVVAPNGEAARIQRHEDGGFSATVGVSLGDSELEIFVTSETGVERSYALRATRHEEPWKNVQVLTLEPPEANAYFGDYLRASERHLYVNASRRGRLYEKQGDEWVFERPSEELVDVELEWMFEAGVSDDALAFVAQPAGGTETLYLFALGPGGDWTVAGEHETGTQGTLRLRGDDLAFVAADRVDFFRRSEGAWTLVKTLAAPALDIGFGLRPTYFDAPGVAFGDSVLVVGAPLDSSAVDPDDCADCAREAGSLFVYERDADGAWQDAIRIEPPALAATLQFGHAASLDGDLLAIGAPREGGVGSGFTIEGSAATCGTPVDGECAPESGAVYLFQRSGASWAFAGMLKPEALREYDYFGDELLLSGDVLLVGAPGQGSAFATPASDASEEDSGGIFAFVREGESYRELGLFKLEPSLAAPFPFPDALQLAGRDLVLASNLAEEIGPGGAGLENAGRVYSLHH